MQIPCGAASVELIEKKATTKVCNIIKAASVEAIAKEATTKGFKAASVEVIAKEATTKGCKTKSRRNIAFKEGNKVVVLVDDECGYGGWVGKVVGHHEGDVVVEFADVATEGLSFFPASHLALVVL